MLRVVLGALILLATMTAIHQDRIGVRETNVFRLINDLALPGWTKWPVWGVMQLGVIGAVPLVALLALATRRLRLAAYAALAGGTIYLVAKLVKEFVQRGHPQTLLDNVHILFVPDRGLGYVSGRATRRWRWPWPRWPARSWAAAPGGSPGRWPPWSVWPASMWARICPSTCSAARRWAGPPARWCWCSAPLPASPRWSGSARPCRPTGSTPPTWRR
jgi:hypothetical protein